MMHNNLIWHKSIFSPPNPEQICKSLSDSLAHVASLWPDSPAVLCDGETYSFHDLASRAAGLAEEINEAANASGPIALVQSVGIDAIAGWFACAHSGRPFLLLEPDHPPARLLELIETAKCVLVLGDHTTSEILMNLPTVKVLISDGRKGTLQQGHGLSPDDPAMIFPTSGSTGSPKLITYSTTTMQVKVQSSIAQMRVPNGASVLIAGSHGNYGFLHHALVFLLTGGAICFADIKAGGFAAVLHAIKNLGARHARFTPSMFRKLAALPQANETLTLLEGVRFSGEPLLAEDLTLAQSILKPECLIQNVYGSTESALFIWSSSHDKLNAGEPTAPIGWIYPLASYSIQPLEDEVGNENTGELLIRSAFHALGDLKEGVIDQERFPLLKKSKDERIYATGDIVRQLPDGSLIHLGRIGRMVKIRGHRVFLNEVENYLRTIPGVTGSAVVERQERDGIVLYGFITTDTANTKIDMARDWLAERLPDFMIPKCIETVKEIPLLQGGKVDYAVLLAHIPKGHDETKSVSLIKGEVNRLAQLWDSILWVGAHEHDADFLALGGDSLSLMVLSAEVERIFGKHLPLEEFRANSTFRNLADILDIETPDIISEKEEKLQARLFWSSTQPSQGIALAMPGFGGWAPALPFKKAGLFIDHDLWVADFHINKGSILHAQRWWKAALEIVEGIKKGTIPPPRIIFGFSIGGGLAWLVAHLLAGTDQCPSFVVMVDAPPLHRLRSFRNRALRKALNRVTEIPPPPVLHIRRAPLPEFAVGGGSTNGWELKDNIQMVIDLPTVSHNETANWNMLSLATDAVKLFINHKYTNKPWLPTLPHPDMLGVQIYHAINGNKTSQNNVMDEFSKVPDRFNAEELITLSCAMYIKNDIEKAKELIIFAVYKSPNSKTAQYVYRRMQRNINKLVSDNIPDFYPRSISSIERSLANSKNKIDHGTPRSIQLFLLAYDVLCSIIAAGWARWKLNYLD